MANGPALTAEEAQLKALRDELSPAKAVERLNGNAKFLVASIGLLATALTFAGLTTIDRAASAGAAKPLAYIGIALGLLAVIVAFATTIVRVEQVRPANLLGYRKVVGRLATKGRVLRVAGVVLLAAVVVEAAAAVVALCYNRDPLLTISADVSGKVTVGVTDEDEQAGASATVTLTGFVDRIGSTEESVDLLRESAAADAKGAVAISRDVTVDRQFNSFRLTYVAPNGISHQTSVNATTAEPKALVSLQRAEGPQAKWTAKGSVELAGYQPGANVSVVLRDGQGALHFEGVGAVDRDGDYSVAPEASVAATGPLALVVRVDGRAVGRADL